MTPRTGPAAPTRHPGPVRTGLGCCVVAVLAGGCQYATYRYTAVVLTSAGPPPAAVVRLRSCGMYAEIATASSEPDGVTTVTLRQRVDGLPFPVAVNPDGYDVDVTADGYRPWHMNYGMASWPGRTDVVLLEPTASTRPSRLLAGSNRPAP